VRCGRCGNENGEGNRFCGMCGAVLVAGAQAVGHPPGVAPKENVAAPRPAAAPVQTAPTQPAPRPVPQAPAAAPTGLGGVTAERRAAPSSPSDEGPRTGAIITGPSFLGLNTPGFHTDPKVDGGRDALPPSSDLDYLLEDEEEPSRGLGKLILVVAALALLAGFGYLHWKQGGFDWLKAGDKEATAAKPTAAGTPTGADSGSSMGSATAASPDGAGAGASGTGTAPATSGTVASPTESASAPAAAAQTTPTGTLAQSVPSQSVSSRNSPAQSAPAQSTPSSTVGPQTVAPQGQATDPNLPASSAVPAAGSDSGRTPPQVEAAAPARKPPAARPLAARPVDLVTEAERYIYGRGVRQDCDHGLHLLKPAAESSNPKAMISLGALYATGTCTPRDLPTAYRWFALALHKEPDNQALQDDLQKLWSQMTQPERQLAIKLSQ
jgi:hypothetical protein